MLRPGDFFMEDEPGPSPLDTEPTEPTIEPDRDFYDVKTGGEGAEPAIGKYEQDERWTKAPEGPDAKSTFRIDENNDYVEVKPNGEVVNYTKNAREAGDLNKVAELEQKAQELLSKSFKEEINIAGVNIGDLKEPVKVQVKDKEVFATVTVLNADRTISFFTYKLNPEVEELNLGDENDAESDQSEPSSDDSVGLLTQNKEEPEKAVSFFSSVNTREVAVQKETVVVAGDSLKSRLETSSIITVKPAEMLFRPEAVVVKEPQVLEPIETSRVNLKEDISTEVEPWQVVREIAGVEIPIITPTNEKAEIASDIQEFGIALIERDNEEVDNIEEIVEIQIEQPIVVNTKVSQEPILAVQSTEILYADDAEGITLIDTADSEPGSEIMTVGEPVTESTPAKVTFASAETEPVYVSEGKVTFPVTVLAEVRPEVQPEPVLIDGGKVTFPAGEVTKMSSAKVTLAPAETNSAKTIFAAVEAEAVVEVFEQTEAPTAVVFQERTDHQHEVTIVREARVESKEAVTHETEIKQVDAVVEKVSAIVESTAEIRQQVITPEVQPVVADRIIANSQRSERLVVEPQKVQVNLQAEAPVESDRVVLFKRPESAEPVREVNETLRVEQVVAEPIQRAEQLSNNQSPIQNDSQILVEEEELTPQPAISLAA